MIKRKVSPEEKITAVESYLNGDRQLHTIVEQYGIAKETFRTWVRNYQIFGREGLRDKHRQASYSAETQTAAVKDYLSGAGSQADICKKYKIYSRTQLQNWIKMYNSHRELRPSRGRGSDIYMTKPANKKSSPKVGLTGEKFTGSR